MAQVAPFPPRASNSPQHPNSVLLLASKEADQGQQQTGQFKLECWSLGKLVALSGARRTPILSVVSTPISLCRSQPTLQRWASIFVPVCLQIRSLWYRVGKLSEQKNPDVPSPALGCLWVTSLLAIYAHNKPVCAGTS